MKLVGADHVGLGSDFDGANMPEGMEDATQLRKITEALMRKGYSDSDIRKILGENTLRVWRLRGTGQPGNAIKPINIVPHFADTCPSHPTAKHHAASS